MGRGWAIVCDFDGTATTHDLGDQVAIHFAPEGHWRRAEDEYREGGFPFSELIRRIFAPITAPPEAIAEFARARAVLRDGFVDFLAACRREGRPFVLASAGLDVYIEPVLERLPPLLRRHLLVRANAARCSDRGLEVRFWGEGARDCGRCGFCKGTVVRDLQQAGHRVALVGDGSADRCAADAADLVFARRSLAAYCEARGIAFRRFESFAEVAAQLPP